MPDLMLRLHEQAALRVLLAAEPVAGRPLPPVSVLETIARLLPCDEIGVSLADNAGYIVDEVSCPKAHPCDPPPTGTGPYYVGFMHWLKSPREAESCFGGLAALGGVDGVAVGFRNGPDHVAQIWLGRRTILFSQRDLAMLALLTPLFQRLLRERPTPRLPANLTVQERRVLMHVAAGRSNAEIAGELFLAPSTIRKHLEHSYRKLGVRNRVSAAACLQGRDLQHRELQE